MLLSSLRQLSWLRKAKEPMEVSMFNVHRQLHEGSTSPPQANTAANMMQSAQIPVVRYQPLQFVSCTQDTIDLPEQICSFPSIPRAWLEMGKQIQVQASVEGYTCKGFLESTSSISFLCKREDWCSHLK